MKDLQPDPDRLRWFLDELTGDEDPEFLREGTRTGYVAGFMHGWTIRLSQWHGKECGDEDCRLCEQLVEALSLFGASAILSPPPPEHMMNLPHLGDQPD